MRYGEFIAPLRGSDSVAAGLVTWGQLRGPGFHRLFPDIYLPVPVVPMLAMRSCGAYLLGAGRRAGRLFRSGAAGCPDRTP